MALRFDLGKGKEAIFLGHDWVIDVLISGQDGEPRDLTGASPTWVLKNGAQSATDLVRRTESSGITIAPDQETDKGHLTIVVDAADTDDLAFPPAGKLYHQLDIEHDGIKDCAMYGEVLVHPVGILPEV